MVDDGRMGCVPVLALRRSVTRLTPVLLLAAASVLAALAIPAIIAESRIDAPLLWWASRASGFVAYIAFWACMLFGALLSARGGDGLIDRKIASDLHQEWTIAALIATAVHIITVILNAHAHVPALAAVIPYASLSLRGAIALGTIGTWGLAVIAASSWLRARLAYNAWRVIHALSFGAFVLALAHSVTAGTDTSLPAARWLYAGTIGILTAGIGLRIAAALEGRRRIA